MVIQMQKELIQFELWITMLRSKMLINGELVDSLSGKNEMIYNPANQEPVAEVSTGGREDALAALKAAQKAFPAWSSTHSNWRAEILHEAARLVRRFADEMAVLLTKEQGKPVKDARKEVLASADVLDYFAEEGKRNFGEWVPSASQNSRSLVIRQPIGVAAIITPWNLPVDLMAWKVGPALAAGCTVVAKPPSQAPLAATAFLQAINDAGALPGAINVVHGPGSEVGAELVENPISRKIAFTGETATGRWIMQHAALHIKRVSLELGGQSPFIVCNDASIEKAVAACTTRAFSNMGQICISINRIYVAKEIADVFISKLVDRTTKLKVGNGMNPGVDLGPMFSHAQRQKTKEHIADAVQKGAKILCGGNEPEGKEYKRGFFFLPTVLVNADHGMKIMREETFGPVAPIMKFETLDQAISLANDTEYGLAAYIFTNDLTTAIHAAEKLESGGVGVNVNNVAELQAPFGGWKQSGFGRELGHYGLEEYLEIKHIRFGL
jgi:succinate-semialdehyde dehydrogenase / glutarate-semialdehyde dehydrogenase